MSTTTAMDPATHLFEEALAYTGRNMIVDAASTFREIVDRWPGHDLADDALYNLGACWLAMNQFHRAADTFRAVIRQYPEATIHDAENAGEHGRTAAKALLGLLAANLGMGDLDQARLAADKLEDYQDSYIARPGIMRSYFEIGQGLLQAALEEDETRKADNVSPDDIIIVEE